MTGSFVRSACSRALLRTIAVDPVLQRPRYTAAMFPCARPATLWGRSGVRPPGAGDR